MIKEKEVIGYYTSDGHIYCIECINKDREIMEKIEKAIKAMDSEKTCIFVIYAKSELNEL